MSNVDAQRFGRIGIDELSSLIKLSKWYVMYVEELLERRKTVDNDNDGDDIDSEMEWNDMRMNGKL